MLIYKYNSNLALLGDLVSIVRNGYDKLFVAVLVHGSVATGEIINYSDFDGLLIVKDEYVNSLALKKFKRETLKKILVFDPLQHHGWFQIKESDLKNYPESYLPHEILKHSRLIYPFDEKINLDIHINDQPDYEKSLKMMLQSFECKIKNKWIPKNLFQLKSTLSQVMLLPSLYYSARYHKGIFKKYSFDAVRGDFSEEEWYVIEQATQIRNLWEYKLNWIQRLILRRPERVFRKITKKYVAPKIKNEFKWDKSMKQSLKLLILKIKTIVNETY